MIASRKIELSLEPFSVSPRGIHIGHLEGDAYFAFNFDSPDGVKIVRGKTASRLIALTSLTDTVPFVENSSSAIDQTLIQHKLAYGLEGTVCAKPARSTARGAFNVWLHVVNGCNFRCFYCYVPDLHSSIDPSVINEHSLSATTADLVAERLVEFCLSNSYQKLHVKFAGGEPTLNLSAIRHFCTSILKMRQTLRITFGMISNGSFCSDDLIPILDEYDIGISLSVDGFEGSHDQVRFTILAKSKVGSWKLLEQNVERLLMAGRKPYFLFTLTRLNAPSLIQFSTWAHSRKLGFRISPVRAQTAVSKSELDFIAQHVIDLYEYLGRCMPESLDFDRDARFAEWNLRKQKQSACGSCRNYIAITERGDMKPCQMSSSAPLSATSHSVSDALLQFRADPLVSLIAQPGLRRGACTRCQFFHTCTGGCPQHTLAVFQDVEHPSPWCQLFGRLLPHYLHAKASHMWRQVSALENGTVRDTELASPDMSHRAID